VFKVLSDMEPGHPWPDPDAIDPDQTDPVRYSDVTAVLSVSITFSCHKSACTSAEFEVHSLSIQRIYCRFSSPTSEVLTQTRAFRFQISDISAWFCPSTTLARCLHDRKRWNSSSRRCGSTQRHSAKCYSINTDKMRLLGKQQTHAQTDEDIRTDRQTLAISCRSSTSISAWPLTCAQLTHVFAVGQMRSIF